MSLIEIEILREGNLGNSAMWPDIYQQALAKAQYYGFLKP